MPITLAGVRELVARHRRRSVFIGVAVVVAVASIVAGSAARSRLSAVTIQRNRLRSMDSDATVFRSAFRQPSLEERAFRFPDSLAIAVSRESRFSLAQRIAQRAEQLGLSDVRVRFAAPDSGEAPMAPELGGTHVAAADYSIALDCRGAFDAVLSLVNSLPAAVALQRVNGERAGTGEPVDYHLALAVFEPAPDSTPSASTDDDAARQIAQLLPYAAAPRDTDLVVTALGDVPSGRDPFVSRSMPRVVASAPADSAPVTQSAKAPVPSYRVTTTLMAGTRRAALINDQLVYVGESLPDGSKLTSVERDRVVVTDHSGAAHVVVVAREGEG
jgi:hypothetical protein